MKGEVHGIGHGRVYIKAQHKDVKDKWYQKHMVHTKDKKKMIIPAKHTKHHNHLKPGDKVHFDVYPRVPYEKFLWYIFPVLGLVIGLLVSMAITKEESGIIIITFLFIMLGYHAQHMLKKRVNIHKEIDVILHHGKSNVKIVKATKKKK